MTNSSPVFKKKRCFVLGEKTLGRHCQGHVNSPIAEYDGWWAVRGHKSSETTKSSRQRHGSEEAQDIMQGIFEGIVVICITSAFAHSPVTFETSSGKKTTKQGTAQTKKASLNHSTNSSLRRPGRSREFSQFTTWWIGANSSKLEPTVLQSSFNMSRHPTS